MVYSNLQIFIVELLGTFLLVVFATGSIVYDAEVFDGKLGIPFAALAPFIALLIGVYAFGKISLAHFNPSFGSTWDGIVEILFFGHLITNSPVLSSINESTSTFARVIGVELSTTNVISIKIKKLTVKDVPLISIYVIDWFWW